MAGQSTQLKIFLEILGPYVPSCCPCARLSGWYTHLPGWEIPWSRHDMHHITVRVQPTTGQRSLAVLINVCPCLVCCQHLSRLGGGPACLPAQELEEGVCIRGTASQRTAKKHRCTRAWLSFFFSSSFLPPPSLFLFSDCRQGFRLERRSPTDRLVHVTTAADATWASWAAGLDGRRAGQARGAVGRNSARTNLPSLPHLCNSHRQLVICCIGTAQRRWQRAAQFFSPTMSSCNGSLLAGCYVIS